MRRRPHLQAVDELHQLPVLALPLSQLGAQVVRLQAGRQVHSAVCQLPWQVSAAMACACLQRIKPINRRGARRKKGNKI